ALVGRYRKVAEIADAKSGHADQGKSDDECRAGSKHRAAAGCEPQQERKKCRDGDDNPPMALRQEKDKRAYTYKRRPYENSFDKLASGGRLSGNRCELDDQRCDGENSERVGCKPMLPGR